MTHLSLALRAVVAASVLAVAGQAHAAGSALTGFGQATSVVAPSAATTSVLNVTGTYSFDSYGSPNNNVMLIPVGANAQIVAISWDVDLTSFVDVGSFGGSWLSEISVDFSDSDQSVGVSLSPAAGDDFTGSDSYSGSGDLIDLELSFNVGADGQLRLEFYDAFDDESGVPDGIWDAGSLTIEYVAAVPEPGSYGMMALGLLAVGGMIRRRRR